MENSLPTRKQEFWNGVKTTFPLVVGAIPFGIIFGALAVNSGITPIAAQAMSLFVFAGSSQFIAAVLVADGAGLAIIIITTFIVNLRHGLYSVTLAPHMKNLPQKWLLPLGFWLTDESFVVVAQRYQSEDKAPFKHWFFLGSAVFMYTNWQLCTFIGIQAGQSIEDPLSWGLDFALIVTFIAILVPLIKNFPMVSAVGVSAITAFLTHSLPNRLGLMIAAILGITAGLMAEKYIAKKDSANE